VTGEIREIVAQLFQRGGKSEDPLGRLTG